MGEPIWRQNPLRVQAVMYLDRAHELERGARGNGKRWSDVHGRLEEASQLRADARALADAAIAEEAAQ